MSLSSKVAAFKKDRTVDSFKNKYPEVYDWFNSEDFIKLFTEKSEVYLQVQYNRYGTPQTVPNLPFTYKGHTVSLDDIMSYLLAEGFDVDITIKYYCKGLIIRLKGE